MVSVSHFCHLIDVTPVCKMSSVITVEAVYIDHTHTHTDPLGQLEEVRFHRCSLVLIFLIRCVFLFESFFPFFVPGDAQPEEAPVEEEEENEGQSCLVWFVQFCSFA